MTFKLNIKTAEQLRVDHDQLNKQKRIVELKEFLRETDYVVLPDYDKEKDEILAARQAARDEIRSLK